MNERRADGLAGGRVPDPGRPVGATHDQGLAVGAERHGRDETLEHQRWGRGLAGGRIPESDGLVPTAGRNDLPVVPEVCASERALMLDRIANRLAGGGVPKPSGGIVASGDDGPAVGAVGDRLDAVASGMGECRADGLAGGRVPESHCAVEIAGDQGPAVGAELGGSDGRGVYHGFADGLTGEGIPQSRRLVQATGQDGSPVRIEGDRVHLALVPHGRSDQAARQGVAQPGGSVVTTDGDRPSIRAERRPGHRACLWEGCPGGEARGRIPDLGLEVGSSGDEQVPIRAKGRVVHRSDVFQRATEFQASRGVPEPGAVVVATGQGRSAIGTERDEHDKALMLQQAANRFACGGVPEPGGSVLAAGQNRFPVRAEGERKDDVLVSQRTADGPARRGIPDPRRVVEATGQDRFPVGAVRHAHDILLMPQRRKEGATRIGVPEPGGSVPAAAQDRPAIGAEDRVRDPAFMGHRGTGRCSRGRDEDAGRTVLAADDDPSAVRTERGTNQAIPVGDRVAEGLAGRDLAKPDRRLTVADQDRSTVRADPIPERVAIEIHEPAGGVVPIANPAEGISEPTGRAHWLSGGNVPERQIAGRRTGPLADRQDGPSPGAERRADDHLLRVAKDGCERSELSAPGGEARPGRVLDIGIAGGSDLDGVRQPEQPAIDLPALAEGQSPVDREVRRQSQGQKALLVGILVVVLGQPALMFRPIFLRPDHGVVDRQGGHRGNDQDRQRGHCRLMVPGPADHADRRWLAIGEDRLIGQPSLDFPGKFPGRVVPVSRVERHGLQDNGLQGRRHAGLDLPRRWKVAPLDPPENDDDLGIVEGRPAGQEAVERGAEAVDVAERPDRLQAALGLFRAHIGRSPDDRTRLGLAAAGGARRPERPLGRRLAVGIVAAHKLGQAPIDDQGLAEGTQHDVRWFEIAMEDPPAVGIRHRIADAKESGEELAEGQGSLAARGLGLLEALDGLLETLAADEPHGIERTALTVASQAIHRDHARMLQLPGDLGFEQKAGPAGGVVGLLRQNLLDCDLAMQLAVQRHADHPNTAPGVRPQRVEAAALGRRLPETRGPIRRRLGVDV